jgi:hypothetical protein
MISSSPFAILIVQNLHFFDSVGQIAGEGQERQERPDCKIQPCSMQGIRGLESSCHQGYFFGFRLGTWLAFTRNLLMTIRIRKNIMGWIMWQHQEEG